MGFFSDIGLILGEFYSPVNPGRFTYAAAIASCISAAVLKSRRKKNRRRRMVAGYQLAQERRTTVRFVFDPAPVSLL